MKIGLIDVDSHNFPNLPLMKISAWHKGKGDFVEFAKPFNHYDILYKSKVFTFSEEKQFFVDANKIIKGGSGYKDFSIYLPEEIENITPDYQLYDCKHAYGFLTRGCIRKCSFCIVHKKEGGIKPAQDIEEFLGNKQTAILLDNNVLACSWGLKQIEKIVDLKIKVDFNQGLDFRLIDNETSKLLSKVKWLHPVRLACDNVKDLPALLKTVNLLRKNNVTPKTYHVYMIVTNDIESAIIRAETMKKNKLDPFAQPYRSFDGGFCITKEQKAFCRWVNHKAIFKTVDWKDYKK